MSKKQVLAGAALLVAACSAPAASSLSETGAAGDGANGGSSATASSGGAAGDDVASTSSSASSSSSSSSSGGGGPIVIGPTAAHFEVRLVDAPSQQAKAIFVTVSRVEAELDSGWTTLVDGEQTVDLLTLQDGAFLKLGDASLPPGHVGQLRLYLKDGGDHHAVGLDDVSHPLTIPSGSQSGIKLVGGFEVPACGVGHITLDFDGKSSLQVTGNPNNAQWMLRPVIRLKALVLAGTCPDAGDPDAAPPESDAGDPDAAPPPPPPDPCASVTCLDTEVCENGSCRPL